MNALAEHLRISLRLHFRNRLALLYGYLFPLVFLVAFWVLYRHEKVPLLRHMGELLTVSILGGACFGLPTTLVGERERGVWRRYRLTPVQRWLESEKLWQTYLALGGSLDPEPDTQSPFHDAGAAGARPVDGRTGLRVLRRGPV